MGRISGECLSWLLCSFCSVSQQNVRNRGCTSGGLLFGKMAVASSFLRPPRSTPVRCAEASAVKRGLHALPTPLAQKGRPAAAASRSRASLRRKRSRTINIRGKGTCDVELMSPSLPSIGLKSEAEIEWFRAIVCVPTVYDVPSELSRSSRRLSLVNKWPFSFHSRA